MAVSSSGEVMSKERMDAIRNSVGPILNSLYVPDSFHFKALEALISAICGFGKMMSLVPASITISSQW